MYKVKEMSALNRIVSFLLVLQVIVIHSQNDVCQRCALYPNSCRKIAGIFMVTLLSKGTYNPVVEIPAPACNINITELGRSRNYIAIKSKRGVGIINGYWKVTYPGQHYGANSVFQYSKSNNKKCPGECVYATGPTNETIVIQLLYYSQNPGISYEFTLPNFVPFSPYEGSRLISATSRGYRHHLRNRLSERKIISNQKTNSAITSVERSPYRVTDRSEGPVNQYNRQELTLKRENQASVPPSSGIRYGYDTLGGQGLSYSKIITNGHRQWRRGRNPLVLAPRPQYISPYKNTRGYNGYYGRSALKATSYERHVDIPNKIQKSHINHITDVNIDYSYKWKISGFTDCSEVCGGGYQTTLIICVLRNTQVTVTDENCENDIKPQTQQVACNTKPCSPRWHADDWASCSVTCGSGTQTRRLECKQKISTTLELSVSASLCDEENKPAIAQQCEMGRCADWKVGSWKTCSVGCGSGTRKRSVKCVDHQQIQIPSSYCNKTKPKTQESCQMRACRTHWLHTPWSNQCSSSCGAGVKTRQVICYTREGFEVQSSLCEGSKQPRDQASCHSDEACGSKWFTGPWSECSADCGSGVKNRYVVCMKVVGDAAVVSPDEDCWKTEKPSKKEDCNNHACGAEWFMTEWSPCSVTCGTGYKTRQVKCLDRNRRQIAGCNISKRPVPRETCQPRQCPIKVLSAENDCRDLYRTCPLVVRSRLCSYKYYQHICCTSCRGRT